MKGYSKYHLHFFLFFILLLFALNTSCADKKTPSLITGIQREAAEARDNVKLRIINSALQIYQLETGKIAQTLDEVIKAGYLNAEDIINHKGEKFTYSPEVNTLVQKACGSCGSTVSNSSKAGDTCPHCGVTWGMEVKSY